MTVAPLAIMKFRSGLTLRAGWRLAWWRFRDSPKEGVNLQAQRHPLGRWPRNGEGNTMAAENLLRTLLPCISIILTLSKHFISGRL